MLKLREFRFNHHPSGVKMLAEFARRGIWVKYKVVFCRIKKEITKTTVTKVL